jgi:hypothetical protein
MSSPGLTRRVNHGRGHRYLLDGAECDGVTTILRDGVPKAALVKWASRTTAGYALDHWAELSELGVSERLRRLEGAPWADRDSAAVRGTQVHALAQRLAHGETVDVPEPLVGHVDAYLAFVRDWAPRELLVEAVIGNRQRRYMGTLDLVAELPRLGTWIIDWKTTASGVYPESALQLAAYRFAEFYLGADGQELPLPAIDAAGVVWLRADGYDLIPVDAGPETFRRFLYAQQVAAFVRADRARFVGEAMLPPAQEIPA